MFPKHLTCFRNMGFWHTGRSIGACLLVNPLIVNCVEDIQCEKERLYFKRVKKGKSLVISVRKIDKHKILPYLCVFQFL